MSKKYFHAILVVATTSIGIVACATSETGSDAEYFSGQPPKDEIICRRQRTVGSHVPVHICRTRAQVEADREAALRAIGPLRTMSGDLPKPPPPPPPPN